MSNFLKEKNISTNAVNIGLHGSQFVLYYYKIEGYN